MSMIMSDFATLLYLDSNPVECLVNKRDKLTLRDIGWSIVELLIAEIIHDEQLSITDIVS